MEACCVTTAGWVTTAAVVTSSAHLSSGVTGETNAQCLWPCSSLQTRVSGRPTTSGAMSGESSLQSLCSAVSASCVNQLNRPLNQFSAPGQNVCNAFMSSSVATWSVVPLPVEDDAACMDLRCIAGWSSTRSTHRNKLELVYIFTFRFTDYQPQLKLGYRH